MIHVYRSNTSTLSPSGRTALTSFLIDQYGDLLARQAAVVRIAVGGFGADPGAAVLEAIRVARRHIRALRIDGCEAGDWAGILDAGDSARRLAHMTGIASAERLEAIVLDVAHPVPMRDAIRSALATAGGELATDRGVILASSILHRVEGRPVEEGICPVSGRSWLRVDRYEAL